MMMEPGSRALEPAALLKFVRHYQKDLQKETNADERVIYCIERLYQLPVTVQLLQDTGVGRTVNALRKKEGKVSAAARTLVAKWKQMVADEEEEIERNRQREEESDEEPAEDDDNGYGDSPDKRESPVYRNRDRENEDYPNNRLDKQKWNDDGNKNKRKSEDNMKQEYSKSRLSESSDDNGSDNVNVQESDEENNNNGNDPANRVSNGEDSVNYRSEEDDNHSDRKESEPEYDQHSSHMSKNISTKHSSSSGRSENNSSRDSHKNSSSSSKQSKSHSSSKESKNNSQSSSYRTNLDVNKMSSLDTSSSKPSTSTAIITKSNDSTKSSHHSKHSSSKERKSEKESHKSKDKYTTQDKIKEHKYEDTDKSSSREKVEKHSSSDRSHKEKSKHSHRDKHSESKNKKHHRSEETSSSSKKELLDSRKRDHKGELKKESSHRSSSKDSDNSKSHKSKSKKRSSNDYPSDAKRLKSYDNHDDHGDGIDGESGASFAEALGMILPNKSSLNQKKKSNSQSSKPTSFPMETHSDSSNEKCKSPDDLNSLLQKSAAKLAPLPPLKISVSALPEISPNYVPRPPPKLIDNPISYITEEEAMKVVMNNKNQRTKVFSGNKTTFGTIPTLRDLCIFVLQENINALEYTGGVPYEIIKPVVDKATPDQLFMLEHFNPYLIEDTDPLWQIHCNKKFRNKQRQEMESWREMYMRCSDEQEAKLKSLTANIKLLQDKSVPVRQTKMAYVDSIVKPPRAIARKQAIFGTARKAVASPAARVPSLANNQVFNPSTTSGVGASSSSATAPMRTSGFIKPKKAPLMQKALQFMKGRNKR